jgi:DNA-binding ferritin-like protein (Dps family)
MADDSTAKAESAQALFCAMADYIGAAKVEKVFNLEELPTYPIFKRYWDENYPDAKIKDAFGKHVNTGKTNLTIIEKYLTTNKDWYISSVKIAVKLIQDIHRISNKFTAIKKPTWSSIFYVRGDKEVMDNIAILFKEASVAQKAVNKLLKEDKRTPKLTFGDINKWSPADIYFASPKAKKDIRDMVMNKEGLVFASLNTFIHKMIQSGNLLPLSLKKQTGEVNIYPVNFSRPYEIQEIEKLKSYGLSNWQKRTSSNPRQARDLQLYYSEDKRKYIQMLHVTEESGGWKANNMDKDTEARHGSLGSAGIFADALAIVDEDFSKKWKAKFKTENDKFKKNLTDLIKNEFAGKKPEKPPKGQKKTVGRQLFEDLRTQYSVEVTNNVIPPLITWFKAKDNADKFLKVVYEYTTSRSDESGPFVIAK